MVKSERETLGAVELSPEERLRFISDWNMCSVFTLFDLKNYEFSIGSAMERLNISEIEVERCLKNLEDLGLVLKKSDGKFIVASGVYFKGDQLNLQSLITCFRNLMLNTEARLLPNDIVQFNYEIMHRDIIGKYYGEVENIVRKIAEESAVMEGAEVYVFCGTYVRAAAPKSDDGPSSLAAQKFAHDIRSPLSALNAVANRFSELPTDIREVLNSATARINDIAEEILDKKRLVEEKAASIWPNLSEKLVKLTREMNVIHTENPISFSSGEDIYVNDDKLDVVRVVSNLINNAVEASGRGQGVSVSCSRVGKRVSVTILDMGKGMDEETLKRIKLTSFTTKNGNGLGVRSAYDFAERFSGSVDIKSRVGVGTQITIHFED